MSRVRSQFVVFSPRLNSEMLTLHLPWKVLETLSPTFKESDHFVTVFDLGTGEHERVDRHLEAAKDAVLAQHRELYALVGDDCHYTLMVYYEFPTGDVSFNLVSPIQAAFAFLRIQVVFHLRATSNA